MSKAKLFLFHKANILIHKSKQAYSSQVFVSIDEMCRDEALVCQQLYNELEHPRSQIWADALCAISTVGELLKCVLVHLHYNYTVILASNDTFSA